MKEHKDVLVDGSDWLLSLKKITGKKVKDITGYISTEFGFPTFQMCDIVFEDGSKMGCEGEHDIAYLTNDKKQVIEDGVLEHIDETNLRK